VLESELSSDGSGLKLFDPGRVSHLWFGLEFGKFHLKAANFSIFFISGQKNLLRLGQKVPRSKGGLALYLLWVKSKLWLGRVRAHL